MYFNFHVLIWNQILVWNGIILPFSYPPWSLHDHYFAFMEVMRLNKDHFHDIVAGLLGR